MEGKRGNGLIMMNYLKGHGKVLEPGGLVGEVSACNQVKAFGEALNLKWLLVLSKSAIRV